MRANKSKILDFIKEPVQLTVPIYQRAYSWEIEECAQLWNDILQAGRNEVGEHFIGPIVSVPEMSTASEGYRALIVDGQQRLTTIVLIIETLARRYSDLNKEESATKLRKAYLVNQEKNSDFQLRLVLNETDHMSLKKIIENEELISQKDSIRIKENFEFLQGEIKKESNCEIVENGLNSLCIVDIALMPSDDPQQIFESLNAKGKKLTQADLIRNFALMKLSSIEQKKMYSKFWKPMEEVFGQEAYAKHFDRFMRHYLTVITRDIPKIDEVYKAFKNMRQSRAGQDIGTLLEEVHKYADYYCKIALGNEDNRKLKSLFEDIRELNVDVAMPLLLELYEDYKKEDISTEELYKLGRYIESYVFRRAICGIATNYLNTIFARFGVEFRKEEEEGSYVEKFCSRLMNLQSGRRFPRDAEFKKDMMNRNLYNFSKRKYWLRKLENHRRKEPMTRSELDEYSIEHIMPRDLSDDWKNSLGADWPYVHEEYLHTLGNLTLTRCNSEYSNHSFKEKKFMENGFSKSPLRLNETVKDVDEWNKEAMDERANDLSEQALDVWKSPPEASEKNASKDMLAEHHEWVIRGAPMHSLFETLRQRIKSLDPDIEEEVFKVYIAYKAKTNFVDIVTQKNSLQLTLNVKFGEIEDPKNLGRDVSNIGKQGNGDVGVKITKGTDLDYVMKLIKQSFDRQRPTDEASGMFDLD